MNPEAETHTYPARGRRLLITGSVMLATTIVTLDMTIANVALPHMQSSLSASSDQIVWVLTSYLIAEAIMTPLASWLANRFGRKTVMVASAAAFTISSAACGLANSLEMMVFARLVQGISGAGLIPLGQATLLDINPPENHGKAMAMAGIGAMAGPMAGPALGGWLTDVLSWRWVFLINIPVGILAFAGMAFSMSEVREKLTSRFDMFGFATISVFLAAFQLMMDRGQQLDWFDSREIWIEAAIMGLFGYLAVVHMATARNTFVRATVFRDRNFALGAAISTMYGVISVATVPTVTIMMQSLLGYTPYVTGLLSVPRGVGAVFGLLISGMLVGRIDSRVLLFSGLSLVALALYIFSHISLETDQMPVLVGVLLQGFGGGLIIPPLSILTFSTLAHEFRNEGTAIYTLVRNIGASIGISALQSLSIHNEAKVAGRLAEGIRPDNTVLQFAAPNFSFDAIAAVVIMGKQVARQAAMVATIDSLWLTCLLALAMLPLTPFMRSRRGSSPNPER